MGKLDVEAVVIGIVPAMMMVMVMVHIMRDIKGM